MNKHFKIPKTYLMGYTAINLDSFIEYLKDTNQEDFLQDILEARAAGVNDGEILCSYYAKCCYASLTVGKNKNITRVRDIEDNVKGILNSGHGSVIEHCQLN